VDGPLGNDTITYAYDELGRVTTRAINGAANTVTWGFDALGRVTSEANVLGDVQLHV
jgi:YD repeat-containing protein